MGRFSSLVSDSEKFVVEGVEFEFKLLGVKHLPKLLTLMQLKSDGTGGITGMNEEVRLAISDLILETLKVSYPTEPVDELERLAMRFFPQFLEKLVVMYSK